MATIPCPNCGEVLPAQARFCGRCGQTLGPAPASAAGASDGPSSSRAARNPPLAPPVVPSSRPGALASPQKDVLPTVAPQLTIFLSAARQDAAFVTRLQADLPTYGVTVLGGAGWEKLSQAELEEALRSTIRTAQVILLVTSPHARQSRSVRHELAIARMYQRPLYSLWVAGEDWSACLPPDVETPPYTDVRGSAYQAGLRDLAETLKKIAARPSGIVLLTGPQKETEEPTFEPRNPYKGLRAFTAQDAGDFFGREQFCQELLGALKASLLPGAAGKGAARLLALVGPSGAGKSSVMLAGLLPRLQRGVLPGSDQWVYLEPLVPGTHPLERLTQSLADRFPERSLKSIREDLEDDAARGLHLLAERLVKEPGANVVLVIDQCEELFTQTTDEQERQWFMDLLLTAATEPRGPLLVLLTLRADFYDRLTLYPPLARLIESHHRLLLPMEIDNLRAVIDGPAMLPDVQLNFEGTLAGDLLFEVWGQPGALPLLQFTLEQLFERRAGHRLTLAAYRELGGVRGALAKQAEATYAALPSEEHRRLARALFLRLLDPGATEQDTTRRRAALAELMLPDAKASEQMRQVADAFVAARLLVTNEMAGTTTIEVSHEALIREWQRLGEWLREAREDIPLQQKISEDVAVWEQRKRPKDRLYHGSQLKEAQAWARRNLPSSSEATFLHVAQRRQRRVRVRLVALVLIVLLTTGAAAGYFLNTTLVTTLADSGPGSLRQDITNAPPGSTISFAPWVSGTIQLTAYLDITKNVTIRGPGAQRLSIGTAPGQYYYTLVDMRATVTISGLTFHSPLTNDGTLALTNCTVSGNKKDDSSGGGIYNAGTLTLTNSTVSDNEVVVAPLGSGGGGGIFNDGKLVLTNSTVSGNKDTGDTGGGIDNAGTLTLTNSTITGNTATGGSGGGISNGGMVTLTNSIISSNTAQQLGGGIWNDSGTLMLTNSTVSGNTAQQGDGGGIFNNGTLTLTNSTVSGNTAQRWGGGILNGDSRTTGLTDSTISSNRAGNGGGIFNVGTLTLTTSTVSGNTANSGGGGIVNAATLMLINSTVSDNTATNSRGGGIENGGTLMLTTSTIFGNTAMEGGGIVNLASEGANGFSSSSTITFCTFFDNQAADGGAIASLESDQNGNEVPPKDITVTVRNSLVAGNQSNAGFDIVGSLTSEGYDLLQNVDPGAVSSTDHMLPANSDLSQFIDLMLRNNAGPDGKSAPTQTLALLPAPGNPAIDAIPLSDCQIIDPAANKPITTDQRGMPRPDDNEQFCDIGAYESSG